MTEIDLEIFTGPLHPRPSADRVGVGHDRTVEVDVPGCYVAAMLFGVTSVVIGSIWDISWGMSIGRDSLWTPGYLAVCVGGAVGGLASALLILKTTFSDSPARQGAAVRIWGFRGLFGAWVSIWGALAMVTAASFDSWWQTAYGLDVQILRPPHVVLALGTIAIGAMLAVLPRHSCSRRRQSRTTCPGRRSCTREYSLGRRRERRYGEAWRWRRSAR